MSVSDRSRAGVRAWVRGAGAGLRRAGPYGIAAFLTASAVAPVAGAALGAPAEFSAALGQLGGMGSNYLADALVSASDRMRGTSPSEDEWRDAVAAELIARLDAGDSVLREEMAELLRAVGAVEVALRAADDHGRRDLIVAFESLGTLAEEAARSLTAITRTLAEQSREQQTQTGLITQSLVAVAALRQDLIGRATVADPPRQPPGDHDGAVPYPGLASFEALDSRFFRGRETLVAELLGRLSEQVLGGPPLVVVGVSGVGKSSVLRAGVLPAILRNGLAEDSGTWPWLVMTLGRHPLATFTERVEGLRTAGFGDVPWVILVDQFEEIFTQCADPAERAAFVEALAELRPGVLIIAVRADFYPQCTELAPMVPLLGAGQVVVGPLGMEELRRAIVEPAAEADLTVEPGLVDVLLRDLGAPAYEPGALPLLAHALLATWRRREGTTLTVSAYRETGGLQKAVAESAEAIYRTLDDAGRARLRAALLTLVTIADGVPVRHRAHPSEVDAEILRPLVEARFVAAGEDTVEISHEALLTGWPRLAGWLAEAREELLLRQRLSLAAADWAAAGEDPDALYRGARLAAAREWAQGRTLPAGPARFLAASEAAAVDRERERERTTKRLRRLVAGLAVALLVVVAGGLVVWRQQVAVDRQSREAIADQRAIDTRTNFFTAPSAAARSALQAWESAETAASRVALLYAQQTTVSAPLGTEAGAQLAAVGPDGRYAATGFQDGRIQLWDTGTQEQVVPEFRNPGSTNLFSLAFSPDGRYLAGGTIIRDSPEASLAVWEVPSGRLLHQLPGIGAATFLPDSSAVLAPRFDEPAAGQIGFWDPATGDLRDSVQTRVPAALAIDVSPDGERLALGGADVGEIVRRDDGVRLTDLGAGMTSAGFAADGTLYGTDADGPVRAWLPDATGPEVLNGPETFKDRNGGRLAVTTDGTAIVFAGQDGEMSAFTLGGPRLPILGGPTSPAAVALSADDRLLLITSATEAPRIIRLGSHRLRHPQIVGPVAVDPSGTRLATGSSDPVIRIWDPATGRRTATLAYEGNDGPLGLAYAPDGSLAAALTDGRVLVFDPAGKLRGAVRLPAELYPGDIAFSPDGALLAVVTAWRDPEDKGLPEAQLRNDPDTTVYDAATLTPRADVRVPDAYGRALAFTPDGRHLLVGTARTDGRGAYDGTLRRYAMPDLTPVDSAEVPGSPVLAVAVSPDSRYAALAHGNQAPVLRLDGMVVERRLGQRPTAITRVAWSPDGRTVAAATDKPGELIRLWDPETGAQVTELWSESFQRGQMVFAPDGRSLFAGTNDWAVTQWHLDPATVVAEICDDLRKASRHGGSPPPGICSNRSG